MVLPVTAAGPCEPGLPLAPASSPHLRGGPRRPREGTLLPSFNVLRSLNFFRPRRPAPRPAVRRPAFRLCLEPLEDRMAPALFAVIGDYGVAGNAEQHVAAQVHSLNPDLILTVGDNNYPT